MYVKFWNWFCIETLFRNRYCIEFVPFRFQFFVCLLCLLPFKGCYLLVRLKSLSRLYVSLF